MKINEIRGKIKDFINEITNVNNSKINNDSKLISDELIDSLGIIQIVTYLENYFQIKIEQNEINLENLETINTMTKFVSNKIK